MGLASGKTKLKLIDIKLGTKRAQARLRDLISDDVQSPKTSKTDRRRKDATDFDTGTEIGMLLRSAREQSEQDLADISNLLRIRLVYLQAIEHGEFKTLPGMTYAIGYVRSYAQHLDLDVDRAIALFRSEAQELDKPRQLVFPSPAPEGKVPGGAIIFVAALLAVVAYTSWYQLSNSGTTVSGYASEIPESLQSWLNQKSDSIASSDGFTSTAVVSGPASEENGSRANQQPGQLTENDRTSTASARVSEPEPAVVAAPEVTTSGSLAPAVVAATAQMPVAASEAAAEINSHDSALQGGVSPEPAPQDVAMPDAPSLVAAAPSNTAASALGSAPSAPVVASLPEAPADFSAGVSGDLTGMAASATSTAQVPVQIAPVQVASIPVAPATQPRGKPQDQAGRPERNASKISGQPVGQLGALTGLPEQRGVIIHANADSWVQVRAADSTSIMTRVMRAGDSFRVPDRDGLRLFTGNAGALTIEVDGEMLPKIGGLGQIARNVDLEPGNLKLRVN
jgi:cytoskeleton protein RodZ